MKKVFFKLTTLVISIAILTAVLTACSLEGTQGPAGSDGKSAYEIAVEQGFEGTVEEWLVSLIGEDGTGIEKVEIDYKGAIVITMTNGERYELWADKFCTHSDMKAEITHPTCGKEGYTQYSCSGCGVSYKDDYTAPTGHHLIDGICFYCKYEAPYGEITVNTEWYDSAINSYTLTTKEQLAGLSYLVNNGNNFSGKTILIEGHIDLGNAEWIPIGTSSTPFAGTFDGQGFTISGLKITAPTSYVGFFGYVSGAIRNFKLTGANVTVNGTPTIDNYAAIACGYSTNKIVGVSTAGHLTATVTNCVGGVVGYITGTISDCTNTAEITAPDANYVGGVAGRISYHSNYNIINLSNSGKISGASYVGGVIGSVENHATYSSNDNYFKNVIDNISNTGAVVGSDYVGGIFGYYIGSITGSYSDGNVIISFTNGNNSGEVSGTKYVGGIFGYAHSDNSSSQVSNTTSSAKITAESYVGGLVGRIENIKMIDCSNSGSQVKASYYYTDGTYYHAYLGGYAGYGYYFENCHNTVEISYDKQGTYVGGIAGFSTNSMYNCSNSANISAPNSDHVGGLVGCFSCEGSFKFEDLSNSGKILGQNCTAGLMGTVNNAASYGSNDSYHNVSFKRWTNTGDVSGMNYVAGFVGRSDYYISGSYSDGNVIFTLIDSENHGNINGDFYVGGIYGYAYSDNNGSHIENVHSSGNISAKAYVGGLVGQFDNIKMINCDNTGSTINADFYYADGTEYYAYVGGYAGIGYHFENCHNSIDITYTHQGAYVGGIAGVAAGSVMNCSNSASITAAKAERVSGLIGGVNNLGSHTFSDLANSGEVKGLNYVAGIIGYLNNYASWGSNDSTYHITIQNIDNSASISGTNFVGGLIGRVNAQIVGSYSDGWISITMIESGNTADIAGVENVGSYIGNFYSDASSYIRGYELVGTVNGTDVTVDTLVGVKSGLTITEA